MFKLQAINNSHALPQLNRNPEEGESLIIETPMFQSGEVNIRLTDDHMEFLNETKYSNYGVNFQLVWLYEKGEEFILPLIVDAIAHAKYDISNISLFIPYVPYARQDRICNKGESFALKVFTQMINGIGFKEVITMDNHSDVSSALINKVYNIDKCEIFDRLEMIDNVFVNNKTTLVAPDAGSEKSVFKLAQFLELPIVQALKIRDVKTKEIIRTDFIANDEDINGKDLLIVDDICDGGRTFIQLAKEIKSNYTPKSISLYITHGIFTYGLEQILDGGFIDHIYVANLMNQSPEILECRKLTKVFDL